jgi:hypothetical protein
VKTGKRLLKTTKSNQLGRISSSPKVTDLSVVQWVDLIMPLLYPLVKMEGEMLMRRYRSSNKKRKTLFINSEISKLKPRKVKVERDQLLQLQQENWNKKLPVNKTKNRTRKRKPI